MKMDEIDHVANRVTNAALCGLVIGASIATYRGLPFKTAFATSASCAICGTAAFGSERIVYNALNMFINPNDNSSDGNSSTSSSSFSASDGRHDRLWISHGIGGMIGGSLCGGIFQRRPMNGALLFTPLMLGVAWIEIRMQKYKEERLAVLLSQSNVNDVTDLSVNPKDTRRS
jgi:hypothetical protein